jgi:hypothetical protein
LEGVIVPTKRLEILHNGALHDIALVDVAVSGQQFVGARALWDVAGIRELFITQGSPLNIGFSSVAGWSCPVAPHEDQAVHVTLGGDGRRLQAPIAPGLIVPVVISAHRFIRPGERLPIAQLPAMLALDGEREFFLRQGETWEVELTWNGPKVLDVTRTLHAAQRQGLLGR